MTFFKKGDELLQDIGLDEIAYSILSQYLTNIGAFVDELIDAEPIRFTRDYFEIQSRIMVCFPSVLIFGTKMITASMKQLVVYEGYYVGKALEDCKYAGKGLSRKNITDDILETKHKDAKQGNFLFSGGKAGAIGKLEYQKNVSQQQFNNEWIRLQNNNNKTSEKRTVQRSLNFESAKSLSARRSVSYQG